MSEAFTDPTLLLFPMAVPPAVVHAAFFDPALMLLPYAVPPGPTPGSGTPAIWLRRRRRQQREHRRGH